MGKGGRVGEGREGGGRGQLSFGTDVQGLVVQEVIFKLIYYRNLSKHALNAFLLTDTVTYTFKIKL